MILLLPQYRTALEKEDILSVSGAIVRKETTAMYFQVLLSQAVDAS